MIQIQYNNVKKFINININYNVIINIQNIEIIYK